MQRRTFVLAIASVMSMAKFGTGARAHQSMSPVALSDLGLPELNVTVSIAGYAGLPGSIAAGRYLVNVLPGEDVEDHYGIGFFRPVGVSATVFLETLSSLTLDEESEAMMLPAMFHEAAFAGGIYLPAGVAGQVVIDFVPGEWIAWADDPLGTQQPVVFDVTGEMPAALKEPESIATFTMGEYEIELTAGALSAGSHVVKIENVGAQPHFLSANTVPAGTTQAQIEALMQAMATGSSTDESGLDPEVDFGPGFFVATQSTGTEVWAVLNLEPGTYALFCHFPDVSDGMPHADHGMFNVVDVGE